MEGRANNGGSHAMPFKEFCNLLETHNVCCEDDWWQLAMKEHLNGNSSLLTWSCLNNVATELNKAFVLRKTASAMMSIRGPVRSYHKSRFTLDDFIIPEAIAFWLHHECAQKALVISGSKGLGKTELACSLLASVGEYFKIDSLETLRRCTLSYGKSLCFDHFACEDYTRDEIRIMLDVTSSGRLLVPQQDGSVLCAKIPVGTRRIFVIPCDMHHFFSDVLGIDYSRTSLSSWIRWVTVSRKLFDSGNTSHTVEF